MRKGQGSFIDGEFVAGRDGAVVTHDPANAFEPVFSTTTELAHVARAVAGARAAYESWSALDIDARVAQLRRLQRSFDEMQAEMAEVITRETGKPLREARGEAKALGARVELTATAGRARVTTRRPRGVPGEERFHPQGVLAVLGPYNYPAHLMNAHVVPALMTGNCVVLKPSEHACWTGELYAEAVRRAGLPPGLVQMVAGGPEIGRALVSHPDIDGVLFTGSYGTGRAITEACLDQPHKLLALEMGGKNVAVVLDDADLPQALAGILQGAFLTAGQRCTATSRVMMQRGIAERLREAIVEGARGLRPGDPRDESAPFGPLANRAAYERFLKLRGAAGASGAEVLVAGEDLGRGAFVTPSVHALPEGVLDAPGYLDEELFGPDLCLEVVDDTDDAIARLASSPYGLSNAVFTRDDARFEHFYTRVKSGLLNRNRSTNGASGQLPFGGVGRSGNQRPAGVAAVGYTTYPVAVMSVAAGAYSVEAAFQPAAEGPLAKLGAPAVAAAPTSVPLDVESLDRRHQVEALLERHRLPADEVSGDRVLVSARTLARVRIGGERLTPAAFAARVGSGVSVSDAGVEIDIAASGLEAALTALSLDAPQHQLQRPPRTIARPRGGSLPRSQRLLERMYAGGFVPRERKPAVVDHDASEGPFLSSVDDAPLRILDAASQIASLGLGFSPGAFLAAHDDGSLSPHLLSNPDTTAVPSEAASAYARFLLERAGAPLAYATWASGGAEANERAFDLCRMNGPGGTKVIAFEGSFHGRTLASLHATYNPVKRKAFELEGYEAAFAPFPGWSDPRAEPAFDAAWTRSCFDGEPRAADTGDALWAREVESLNAVREFVKAGEVCCVIIEPMQGEGGDQFATARFMNGLRALTRGLKVPLVFDEVQTGLGLSGSLFWHHRFKLRDAQGAPDGPDCVTLAKKAQLGVCLSTWADPRPAPAHVAQAARGLIHARAMSAADPVDLDAQVKRGLGSLSFSFPKLLNNPRIEGFTFGFDLPSKHEALQVIAQRFYRGFMAYVAGERTVRFRLNAAWTPRHVDTLMDGIREALAAVARGGPEWVAPPWLDAPPAPPKEQFQIPKDGYAWLVSLSEFARARAADRLLLAHGSAVDAGPAFTALGLDEDPDPADALAALEALDASARDGLALPAHLVLAAAYGARVIEIGPADWPRWRAGVMAIEDATYEDGRRETEAQLRAMVEGEDGISLLATRRLGDEHQVLGYAFGGPASRFEADGPRQDPLADETFYSSNITVHPRARGAGLGVRLKRAQVVRAAQLPRYNFMSGRNRVGNTDDMARVNRNFGAYVVEHYRGNQYGDLSGQAAYYRQPIRAPRAVGLASKLSVLSIQVDWASGVQAPLGARPKALTAALERGAFRGPVGTKLTLSNFISAEVVRYAELLRALAPRGLPHAFFTSGRDELVDKGLRALRVKRPDGRVLLGLERQFMGTTTAAARSLTDPEGHATPFGWYEWPRLPHPAEVGPDAFTGALLAAVQRAGAEKVLGLVVEVCGERSGHSLDEASLDALFAVRRDTGVPIVAVETASALGRTADSLWACSAWAERPDHVWWYAGAQLGHIFTSDDYFVEKPLTLISTWDGDELSIIRAREHLLHAHRQLADIDRAGFAKATRARFPESRGAGLLQAVPCDAPSEVAARAAAAGLFVHAGYGCVVLTPALDSASDEWERGFAILERALKG